MAIVASRFKADDKDCPAMGFHRFGQARVWPIDQRVIYQACRKCGELNLTQLVAQPSGRWTRKLIVENAEPQPPVKDISADNGKIK